MAAAHLSSLQADWEPVAPLPEPNGGFMAGCVADKIVLAGGTNWEGGTKHWLDVTRIYDPTTDTWTAGPALPHPLAYAACASDGTRLCLAGGADGKSARTEVYALDANLRLAKIGNLAEPAAFAGGALRDGKFYALGGTPDPDDWSKVTPTLREIDLATGKVATRPSLDALGHGIGLPALVVARDRILSFSGAWLDPATKEVANIGRAFTHDLAANKWQAISPLHKPARGLSAVALDDHRIYLAGGYGTDVEGFLDEAFIYDADTDRYTPAKPLPFKALTCLVKCGAHIYALGGEDKKQHRTAQCWRIRVEELK